MSSGKYAAIHPFHVAYTAIVLPLTEAVRLELVGVELAKALECNEVMTPNEVRRLG